MKFMVKYTITDQDKFLSVARKWSSMSPQERAQEPGEGVTKIGGWHDLSGRHGVVIIESNDTAAVGRWVGRWNPYLDIEVSAVVDDEEVAAIGRLVVMDADQTLR